MTLRFCTVAGALALLAIAVPAWAASTVTVAGVWSRPADQTGVVYATIENASGTADSLLSASSPVAKTVQIHESMPASPGPAASGSISCDVGHVGHVRHGGNGDEAGLGRRRSRGRHGPIETRQLPHHVDRTRASLEGGRGYPGHLEVPQRRNRASAVDRALDVAMRTP